MRHGKPYCASTTRKPRPAENLYILKEVFVLVLKCELTYSTPAFSQEIRVDFEEIAHAKTEDVTK